MDLKRKNFKFAVVNGYQHRSGCRKQQHGGGHRKGQRWERRL